jgi:ferredoxin
MANLNNRHELNVEGTYFCTTPEDGDGCLPCGLCYNQLPEVFAEDDDGYAFVHKQPDDALLPEAEELIRDCPVDSIGKE